MFTPTSQVTEISLTDFRKVISKTLNSDQMQIVNVKNGRKKVIVDLSLFEDMYRAYQNQEWQDNLNQLQESLAPQVIKEIGQNEYDRVNNLTDLDEIVANGVKLKNNNYASCNN